MAFDSLISQNRFALILPGGEPVAPSLERHDSKLDTTIIVVSLNLILELLILLRRLSETWLIIGTSQVQ